MFEESALKSVTFENQHCFKWISASRVSKVAVWIEFLKDRSGPLNSFWYVRSTPHPLTVMNEGLYEFPRLLGAGYFHFDMFPQSKAQISELPCCEGHILIWSDQIIYSTRKWKIDGFPFTLHISQIALDNLVPWCQSIAGTIINLQAGDGV